MVLLFWYWLTQVVLEKRPLNECSSNVVFLSQMIFVIDSIMFTFSTVDIWVIFSDICVAFVAESEAFAANNGCLCLETSAKDSVNVGRLFTMISTFFNCQNSCVYCLALASESLHKGNSAPFFGGLVVEGERMRPVGDFSLISALYFLRYFDTHLDDWKDTQPVIKEHLEKKTRRALANPFLPGE